MDHKTRLKVLKSIIHPETLKWEKNAYGRELKLLKYFEAKFPDEDFWFQLNPGEYINSLAIYRTPDGEAKLRQVWDIFTLEKTQRRNREEAELEAEIAKLELELNAHNDLDKVSKSNKLGGTIRPKPNAIDWVDSD